MSAARVLLALMLAVPVLLTLDGCNGVKPPTYQGWIEADLIFVAPDEPGRVEELFVREGNQIAVGAPLFRVDSELQRADLGVAEASFTNAQQAFNRAQQLLKTSAGTQKNFEDAEAGLRSAEARLNSARTRLTRRTVSSPVAGVVQQVYFRPGEVVPSARPVVALLPPGNIKVRFFVPEPVLPTVAIGDTVKIRCDGCADDISARVSFISRSSEFTPPVIYSLEERAKLVFLIEARSERPDNLRVGQPVTVALAPPEAKPPAQPDLPTVSDQKIAPKAAP